MSPHGQQLNEEELRHVLECILKEIRGAVYLSGLTSLPDGTAQVFEQSRSWFYF